MSLWRKRARWFVVVGPEGGIAPDELAALTRRGRGRGSAGPAGAADLDSAAAVALGALGVLTARWEQTGEVGPPGPLAADQPEPPA